MKVRRDKAHALSTEHVSKLAEILKSYFKNELGCLYASFGNRKSTLRYTAASKLWICSVQRMAFPKTREQHAMEALREGTARLP